GKNHVVMSRAGNNCPPRLFLDGVPASTGGPIDEVIEPMNVEAIEVYRGAAEIPAQYGGSSSACGVIVIWTRSGS
ncbi:MAG TPA: hypothetical protein VFX98_15620, partial [Longimicrobiaceae bacterium]|nr:hypothetical protein [Longimicrobiaceae bacterium]